MGDEQKATPPEPTAAQLREEIDRLKAQLAGAVPAAERDALRKELEAAKAELAALKAPPPPPAARPSIIRFPKLF